jgi:hypothetical protein
MLENEQENTTVAIQPWTYASEVLNGVKRRKSSIDRGWTLERMFRNETILSSRGLALAQWGDGDEYPSLRSTEVKHNLSAHVCDAAPGADESEKN